jgi:phosphatidylglycerophosphate synthase
MRGVFTAGLASFVGAPYPAGLAGWLPGLVFLLIATGDFVDGYLARRYAHTTILGRKLDLMVDLLAAFIAIVLLVAYGRLPRCFLLIGFAPLIFHGLLWLRRARDQRVYVTTTWLGSTMMQMCPVCQPIRLMKP